MIILVYQGLTVMYSGQPGYSGTDPYALNRGMYQNNMSWNPMGYYTCMYRYPFIKFFCSCLCFHYSVFLLRFNILIHRDSCCKTVKQCYFQPWFSSFVLTPFQNISISIHSELYFIAFLFISIGNSHNSSFKTTLGSYDLDLHTGFDLSLLMFLRDS